MTGGGAAVAEPENINIVENIKCESKINNSGEPYFHLKWRWLSKTGGPLPSLRLYCCLISEDELLKNSLFESDMISQYLTDEINSVGGIEQWRQKNPARCIYRYCRLTPSGDVQFDTEITVGRSDCIYFFCMCDADGGIFKRWTGKVITGESVRYSKKEISMGLGFRPKKLEITLERQDSRRIILKSAYDQSATYSLLPKGGQKYYLSPDMRNFELIYLSELIKVSRAQNI